jgi:hypothetical protein
MPITRVRIIDPQYQFEELPGYIAQVFPGDSLAFGVVFPQAMVSGRYALDDLEVGGFISHDEFNGYPIHLTAERLNYPLAPMENCSCRFQILRTSATARLTSQKGQNYS